MAERWSFEKTKSGLSRTSLEFFGVMVDAFTEPQDISNISFFFRPHIVSPGPTRHAEVILRGREGFFRSLLDKDSRPKLMALAEYDSSDRIVVRAFHEFTGWSGIPSPLPPFFTNRLRSRYLVAPAAVVVSPTGSTVAITGRNYVGKTSIGLEMLTMGWALVSDHLLIIDSETGRAEKYLSPIGFRRKTLEAYATRLSTLETRETLSEDTGLVVLARPEALFPRQIDSGGCVTNVIHLLRSEQHKQLRFRRERILSFNVFPPTRRHRAMALLPRVRLTAEIPTDCPPSDVAEQLAARIP